jgi:hypothetical protein
MIFSKILIFILATLFFIQINKAHSFPFENPVQTVLVRDHRFNPIFIEVELPDLISTTRFEGLYFKIVQGKNEEPISLNEGDEELRLKAATTYYHLNQARNFWVHDLQSDYVRNMKQITVRIDITNKFSDLGHFQHDSIDPQYNNALSIPSGTPMEGVDLPSWNHEIWFRPSKVIRTEDLPASGLDADGNPLTKYISVLSSPLKNSITNRLIQISLQKLFNPKTVLMNYKSSVLKQFELFAAISLFLEASKRADRIFLSKYYYLDTAMVPEIIYHEFSHIALSDHLALTHSTPVLEGMADFFATSITNVPRIGAKIKNYSLSKPKNGKNNDPYSSIFETSAFANSDFVLSVLWDIKEEFGDFSKTMIYGARTRLATESSDIKHDLIRSLLDSCTETCTEPKSDRMRLREIFEDRGF